MKIINTRNVHLALPVALAHLKTSGVQRSSRYGEVWVAPTPVTTVYQRPAERVLFWAIRDANPFFHFAEAIWMIAGRQDVKFVAKFAKRMETFSDDGKVFHGAYGYRWRNHLKFDQLSLIIKRLKENPDDRRQVLQIWDSKSDLFHQDSKDIPCNLTVHFQISVRGALDMTVFNRSNDIIWGCYGANAVHFSMLQEYMARCIGVPQGVYYQISDNWHGYINTAAPMFPLIDYAPDPFRTTSHCPYENGEVQPFPIMETDEKTWNEDLQAFLNEEWEFGYRDIFFRRVAMPIFKAHKAYSKKDIPAALEIMQQCLATDWKKACIEWLERRKK